MNILVNVKSKSRGIDVFGKIHVQFIRMIILNKYLFETHETICNTVSKFPSNNSRESKQSTVDRTIAQFRGLK